MKMKFPCVIGLIIITILACNCSSLQLEPVNFGWPVERVLDIDSTGKIDDIRYSLSFDVKPIFENEFQDSLKFIEGQLRIIRDTQGYYFITAKNFKNVYVFYGDDGKLLLDDIIFVSEKGLTSPAFNQRPPYIELLLNENSKLLINNEGIKE